MEKTRREKKVVRTITLPSDIDTWVAVHVRTANTNVSEMISSLLYQKKAQVEKTQDQRQPER